MSPLTRRQCLISFGAAAASQLVATPVRFAWSIPPVEPGARQETGSDTAEDADVDPLARAIVARSLVFDGCVQPYIGASGVYPCRPREIARQTGILAGFRTIRTTTLETHLERECLRTIRSFDDLERARGAGEHGCVLYVQGHLAFGGSTEKIRDLKERGFRAVQLAYLGESELGGGADCNDVPLSALGRAVVAALETERMIVDVSHCGQRTTLDACAAATRPVLACHANAAHVCPVDRNKSDEEIVAIAKTGGVIGVMRVPWALRRDRTRAATIADVVAHVDHVVQTAGPAHAGFATDGYAVGGDTKGCEVRLASSQRWGYVVAALLARGYAETDIEGILGGNFVRALRECLAPG